MRAIVKVIHEDIRQEDAECLPCDRIYLDYDRHREYLESEEHPAEDPFENPAPRGASIATATMDGSSVSPFKPYIFRTRG